MLRVLGMLAGVVLGGVAGLLAAGVVRRAGRAGHLRCADRHRAIYPTIFPRGRVGVGGGVAMIVAVVAGVWAGALATLGSDARRRSSFAWWIVNRLMFLAAATSLQGSIFYFLMYAFKLTATRPPA